MAVPLTGFVNGLVVAPSGRFVVAAVGQEHRLGRWFRVREARNGCAVVNLPAALHRKPRPVASAASSSRRAADGGGEDEEDEKAASDGDDE